ncbi:MAG: tetratricopeptide repeat protein [Nitrospirota bacterium]
MKKKSLDKKTSLKKNPQHEKKDHFSFVMLAVFLILIGVFGIASFQRNAIYQNHVTLWENIVKRSPEKRRAHENYGQALSSAGQYQKALQEFRTVVALPDDGTVPPRDLYREIGVVYYRLDQYDEAVKAWETGLHHDPYDPSLLNNLSIVMVQLQRFDEAALYAEKALSVAPGMPQALNTMGQISMIRREYEKAVHYFSRALDQEPDVAQRYWNVALAFEKTRQYDKASHYAQRYVAMEQDPVSRQRGRSYLEYLTKLRSNKKG